MDQKHSGGIVGLVSGIGQSMIASICYTAIGAVCFATGLSQTGQLNELSNWPIWAALVGTLFLISGGANTLRLFLERWNAKQKISRPYTDRIGILLARLVGDDEGNSKRENIYESLKLELGHAAVITKWPESLSLSEGADFDVEHAADKTAQKWLREKGNDVLIWGRLKSDTILSLRFTLAEGASTEAHTHVLTAETLELPLSALKELGSVIAVRAAALAAPAVHNSGHYLVPRMRDVVERLRALAAKPPASFSADTCGSVHFGYALACQALGAQGSDARHLEEAIAAYRSTLKEWTRDRVPLQWAMTQNNLGNALSILGKRDADTARLEEAVAAYRAALEERTRDRVPLQWATTQNNLGNSLRTLGDREAGTTRLEEAVAAYRAALEERTRDRVPLQWATTQNNLGNAFKALGERDADTIRLEEAVAAYRAALEEFTRDRVPLQWAMTQNNLGNALSTLGEREADTARLEKAVAAYRDALEEFTRDRVPLQWAMTQNNLGTALGILDTCEAGTSRLEQAVTAFRAALEERTRDRVPLDWATTQNNLGTALQALGAREADTTRLEEAVAVYRASLEERTRDRVPLDWAMTQNNLGNALQALGKREADTTRLEKAVAAYRAALEVFQSAGAEFYIQVATDNLAQTEALIAAHREKS